MTAGSNLSDSAAGGTSDAPADAASARVHGLPPAGPEPRAAPPSSTSFIVVALILCAIGALCIRELLVFHEIINGAPWLADSFTWAAQLTWRGWMRYAAPAAILVGVVILVSAVRPRRRTHLRLQGDPPVWLTPTDVARACSARAGVVDPVTSAETTATRRKIVVTVSVAAGEERNPLDDAALERRVRDAVEPFADKLTATPRLGVKIIRVLPAADRSKKRRVQ